MEGNKGREEGGTTNPQLFGKLAIYTNAHAPNRATGGKKKMSSLRTLSLPFLFLLSIYKRIRVLRDRFGRGPQRS